MPDQPAEDKRLHGRSRQAPLHVESLESLDAAEDDWAALTGRSRNIFTTFEWAKAWTATLGEDCTSLLAVCRRADGSAAGLLPLVVRREGRLRVIRFLGHGPADQLAPICSTADRPQVAAALRRFLQESGCDLFIGEAMPEEEGWAAALSATVLAREATPVLRTEGRDWEQYLAGRSRNFRQQVRRRRNRLADRGDLRFRLTRNQEELPRDLEILFDLHDARWAGHEATAFMGPVRALHRRFAAAALERGWLRLWVMELDHRPLAAWYGFRFGGAEWFYQSGRDPHADQDSVGFVLFCHTVQEAMNDGLEEYRLLRGDEAYKARFANHDPGLLTIGLALSRRGRAALLDIRARPAIGRALRRLQKQSTIR